MTGLFGSVSEFFHNAHSILLFLSAGADHLGGSIRRDQFRSPKKTSHAVGVSSPRFDWMWDHLEPPSQPCYTPKFCTQLPGTLEDHWPGGPAVTGIEPGRPASRHPARLRPAAPLLFLLPLPQPSCIFCPSPSVSECTVARNAVTEWAGTWAGCQLRLCLLQLLLFALGLVLDTATVCCQPLIVLL